MTIVSIPSKQTDAANAYFRLKINNLDSSYKYSEVLFLKSSCDNAVYQLCSNPVRELLQIVGLKDQDRLVVRDMLGRIVANFSSHSGNNIFDIHTLSSAMYIVQVINNEIIKATLKIIKQ